MISPAGVRRRVFYCATGTLPRPVALKPLAQEVSKRRWVEIVDFVVRRFVQQHRDMRTIFTGDRPDSILSPSDLRSCFSKQNESAGAFYPRADAQERTCKNIA
jgi:hypothetical protein